MSKQQAETKNTSARKPSAGAGRAKREGKRAAGKNRQSFFQQHQTTAVDSLSRLLLEPGSSLLTWFVIGIALALPLCLLLLLQNLQQLNTSLDEAGNITLFMAMDTPAESLEKMRDELRRREGIAAVEVITADEALDEFQTFSGFGDALAGLDDNPLPAELVVTPLADEVASIRALADELGHLDGVDYAQVDLEWLQRLFAIVALAKRLTAGLAALLCAGVVLVVGNTVRLAIENRRDEIRVVKLVGGTDAYVSRPFLYTGIWYGVGGGLVAALLAVMAFLFLHGPFDRLVAQYNGDYKLSGLAFSDLFTLLLISASLGLAGAWLSVMRHLRRIEPK